VGNTSYSGPGAPFDLEAQRTQLKADLKLASQEFHTLIGSLSEEAWTQPSHNSGWTNSQVLFHILLGFILVRPLALLLILFGHLPAVCSKVFAAILNLATPLFDQVNAIGPRMGARWLGRAGIIRKFDRVYDGLFMQLDSFEPRHWKLTMCYPTRWDPRFQTEMRLEDVFRFPIAHLRHHRAQLRTS
jgi:DinB superfamily